LKLEASTNNTGIDNQVLPPSADLENELETPNWVMDVPDAVTPCQGYDVCLDLRCGSCYDSYLGAHTSCGKMTYFDCTSSLPSECQPMRCTETNINEVKIEFQSVLCNLLMTHNSNVHKVTQAEIHQATTGFFSSSVYIWQSTTQRLRKSFQLGESHPLETREKHGVVSMKNSNFTAFGIWFKILLFIGSESHP
jgi:hypothetical protein